MPKKNLVQDVIPPKRSIRDIELPRSKKSERITIKQKQQEEEEEVVDEESPKEEDFVRDVPLRKASKPKSKAHFSQTFEGNGGSKSRKWLYVALGILAVTFAFGVSAFFKSAIIQVTPKQDTKTFSQTFTARKDATNDLGFQVVTISKDVEKTVQATSQSQVSTKARGKIVIYNNTVAQPLVATTRFQTPEGLVFRILNNVTVPGKQTVAGKMIPGSVEVTVEADKAGEAYNIGLKDFTVPGFKGDPRYTLIYGRSKTAMTGGGSGLTNTVSADALTQADSEIEAELKTSLTRDLSSQIPANFVLYPQSMSFSFEPVSQSGSSSGSVVLRKTGTTSAIIFDKGALSRAILSKISTDMDSNIKITNLENLNFAYANNAAVDLAHSPSITFTLNGDANLVWVFDENKLKSDLLGLSKTDAKSVIATYPSIKEAWIETKPFWSQTIPKEASKVTLINTLAK